MEKNRNAKIITKAVFAFIVLLKIASATHVKIAFRLRAEIIHKEHGFAANPAHGCVAKDV